MTVTLNEIRGVPVSYDMIDTGILSCLEHLPALLFQILERDICDEQG